jgi:PTH1 family peptidyl-tRNA hydrolase
MKLILGLGNVGAQYAQTRHNLGFMITDELARLLGATWAPESKFKADIATATLNTPDGPQKLLLAKPTTMMNLSGESARHILDFYKLDPADVWAIFDDVDVPFGRLRLRVGGSGSGHQGVNSLIQHLGPGFTRVKAGISLNDRTREPSEVYVLKPFRPDERDQLPQLIVAAAGLIQSQLELPEPEQATFALL